VPLMRCKQPHAKRTICGFNDVGFNDCDVGAEYAIGSGTGEDIEIEQRALE
jgi:hypothetical protein